MQLEWCLRGEMEAGGGAESGVDSREPLLDELLATRDRIQARLHEAQQAVAEKDREYMRRRHEEADDPSRCETTVSTGRTSAYCQGADEEGRARAFGELQGSVDRQMSRMSARLEDARSALEALVQKVSVAATSPKARLLEPGHQDDGVEGLSGFYGTAQLPRAALDEQHWLKDSEKEMYSVVVEGFLRDINVELECRSSQVEGSHLPPLHHDIRATEKGSDESQSLTLKNESRLLQATSGIPQEKSDGRQSYHSEDIDSSHDESETLTEEKVGSEFRYELQDLLYSAIFGDLARKLGVLNDAQKLSEERGEVYIRDEIACEIYKIISGDLVKKLADETVEHLIRTSINDEVQKVFVARTLNEWKSIAQKVHNDKFIYEEIDCIAFGGMEKDLTHNHDLSSVKSEGDSVTNANMGKFSTVHSIEQLEQSQIQTNVVTEGGNADSDQHQNSKESDLQAKISADKDGVSSSTNGNVEEATDDHRMVETEEAALSLSMPPGGVNQNCTSMALVLDEKPGANHISASNSTTWEQSQCESQKSMFIPLSIVQEMLTGFEAVTRGKTETLVLRLRYMDKQMANLVGQVKTLKRSEVIYRKAFTRRCCDLQTAEAEVDLLGDEVELLLGLLTKTYKVLDHYSPVLQHYNGIREVLKQLATELAVRY